jgi:hypothetical protein
VENTVFASATLAEQHALRHLEGDVLNTTIMIREKSKLFGLVNTRL